LNYKIQTYKITKYSVKVRPRIYRCFTYLLTYLLVPVPVGSRGIRYGL